MATIIKRIDASARVFGRSVTFVSATDFVLNDVVDIESSLGGPAVSVTVETAAASTCTFRQNSLRRRYPLLATAKSLGFPAPDLQTEAEVLSADAPEYSMTAGQILNLDLPAANLEFTALAGTVTVTVRS